LSLRQTNFKDYMKQPIVFFLFVFIFSSCGSEEGTIPTVMNDYDVDPEFEPYVQEFIREGAKRGHNIDFSDTGLKVEFSTTDISPAAGLCYLRQHHVVIDKVNWFRFSERFRSFLLFHELGHCELDRLHRNEQFQDGSWRSIMRGDPFIGFENRMPVPYFGFRIDHYINELFNPNTSPPTWANRSFDYNEDLARNEILSFEDVNRVNERVNSDITSYEFEFNINLESAGQSRTRIEWSGSEVIYFLEIIPTWGYYLGVKLEGLDNYLFYDNNITLQNNKPIEKITIRNHQGLEQIFINDLFIYHFDGLTDINSYKIEAKDGNQINSNFNVNRASFYVLD